jgi:hypothetical protein
MKRHDVRLYKYLSTLSAPFAVTRTSDNTIFMDIFNYSIVVYVSKLMFTVLAANEIGSTAATSNASSGVISYAATTGAFKIVTVFNMTPQNLTAQRSISQIASC